MGVTPEAGGRVSAFTIGLLMVAATAGLMGAQGAVGPAWLVRSLDTPSDRRESRPDLLDTPILPGSVMKALTVVAALETHVIEPETARLCRRTVVVGGRRYTCSHPDLERPLTAAEALAHSCNDFFVSLAPRLSRSAMNDIRARVGLPPVGPSADFAASLVGLDGPRITPRLLLDVFTRLIGAAGDRSVTIADATRRVLLEGLRGAATYGSASELGVRSVSALAKTGTAPMPGGGALGVLVAFTPAVQPRRAVVVVAPGAAGRDATSIAADLLADPAAPLRVGMTDAAGRTRVETLDLEDYVARVLAGEGQPRAPDAAQQALAIAARTFALANRNRHGREGYDLCDTTHCQVIRPATTVATRAAAATAGRVLARDHRPASIFYSAWCGGRSAVPSEVWPGAANDGFLPAHADDACASEPIWTSEITAPEIERALRAAGLRGDRLRDLRVLARTASGRVARVRADGFLPPELSGEDFRAAVGRVIGWQRLKSTLFEMRRGPRGYAFIGRGSGHGVGMCVIGAGSRAAKGATAEDILAFYYPGLSIEPYTQAPSAVSPSVTDVLLALPGAEEGSRAHVLQLVRDARDTIAAAASISPPSSIRVTVHPTVEGFRDATGKPWWVAGASDGTSIHLLPVGVLTQRGQLERTIRHEVAHVLLGAALRQRPIWVREGAALYFTDPGTPAPAARLTCPTDEELLRPASAQAQRDAYARAEGCFRRQVADGRSWRDVE